MMKKFGLASALFLLAATPSIATAQTQDTLRVGVEVDAKNLDPQNSVDAFSFSMQKQIYEPLMTVDGKTKKLIPVLVEKWEVLDPQTYKFHLKKGVKFHSGEEMTAEDVVFSLKRVTSSDSVFAGSKGLYINPNGFEILDKYTVIVRTNGPVGGFLESMKHPYAAIMSKKAVTEAGKEYFRNPVGTGPYKYVNWVKGEYMALESFPDYHGEKGNFPKIRFVILPDNSSRMIALETKKVDLIYSVPYNEFERLKAEKKVQLAEAPGLVLLHLGLNTKSEKLKDPRVRMALEYAINKEAYNQVVYSGHAIVPPGPLPTASGYYPKDAKAYGYDPAKAKALLKEAGYEKGLKLSIWVINAQDRINGATMLQAMLGQVGINLDIQVMENALFDERLKEGKHDMYIGTWGMQTNLDAGIFWQALFTKAALGSTNKTFTDDDALDSLIKKATEEVRDAEREVLFKQIWDRINELHPMVYLSIANEIYASDKNLTGIDELYDGKINYLGKLKFKQ